MYFLLGFFFEQQSKWFPRLLSQTILKPLFRGRTNKEEFQDRDLLGDNDEIDEMTLRLGNLTREIEKAKARQKIMMGSVDQQRDILLAVAEHVGVEVNLPTRVKME